MPSGLSFGLIHPRPPPFTSVRGPPVRAGHGRRRTVVNSGAQYSKACEGASLPWVQIPPPPPLTRHDAEPKLVVHRSGDLRVSVRVSFAFSADAAEGRSAARRSTIVARPLPLTGDSQISSPTWLATWLRMVSVTCW